MTTIEYQWSDIWLLLSIILGGGEKGASLYDIIKTGDGLNHAIFSHDELEGGFARLTAGGLITEEDKRFFPTEKAIELYKEEAAGADNNRHVWYRLEQQLEVRSARATPFPNPKNNLTYPGFSSEAVKEAYEQWHNEAQQWIEQHVRKKENN